MKDVFSIALLLSFVQLLHFPYSFRVKFFQFSSQRQASEMAYIKLAGIGHLPHFECLS